MIYHIKSNFRSDSKSCGERIQFLILHYTAVDFKTSLEILTHGGVSAHYLVPEIPIDGKFQIFELVPMEKKAYHAGKSQYLGKFNLNDISVGVEIVNLGNAVLNDKADRTIQWLPFPETQIEVVIELCRNIIHRYGIEPTHVVGHSDIATPVGRKLDPGPLFPWKKLYDHGIGAWYEEKDKKIAEKIITDNPSVVDISWIQKNFKAYGYAIEETGYLDDQTRNVISVFQMHFRSSDYSGIPDIETYAILYALMKKYYPKISDFQLVNNSSRCKIFSKFKKIFNK